MEHAVFLVMAPLIFLMSWKHSFGACGCPSAPLDPEKYLQLQVETLLYGLCPAGSPLPKESQEQ
jgi:TetR/AcrR family transcriptional regulator